MEQLENGIPGASGGSRTMLTNTIIMQGDGTIQEIWDIARTIKCDWIDNFVKTIAFNPFSVGMLNSQEVRFGGETIDCWMDLKLGRWPNIDDVDSIVKIGETLSLLVYARDNRNMYDVSIQDCYAYGGPNYDDFNTPRIQLTDSQGCILKEKLISPFYTAREQDSEGEVIVTYAFVQAFKFPDAMNVFMTCNVEVCKGDCDNRCGAISTTEGPFRFGSTLFGEPITTLAPTTPYPCPPGSTSPKCQSKFPTNPCPPGSQNPNCNTKFGKELNGKPTQQIIPSITTSKPPRCFLGSNDPRCPKPTTPAPPICFPGATDPRCPKPTTPAPLRCFPGSTDPRCPKPTTRAPPRCFPGSTDPRCPKPTTPAPPRCFPGSTDRRCPKPTTRAPPKCFSGSTDSRCPKPTTLAPPKCFRGSKDPRCPKPAPTTPAPPRCFPGSTDPRCPKPTTTPAPLCAIGSLNPKCPPTCFRGSKDPRCPKPTTTPAPPRCFPGSSDPRCPKPATTRTPLLCLPGSNNPRCPKPTTPAPPKCNSNSPFGCLPNCFPGSLDSRCPKPTTTPAPPICIFGSTDPRCPRPSTTPAPPRCFIGSTDPRCPKLTPIPNRNCVAGSTDPQCQMDMQEPEPQPTTQAPPKCFPGSPDPRCPIITSIAPSLCFFGSPDPRCRPSITTPAPPICIPGSKDPRCPQTTLPIRFGSTLFPATITTLRPTTPRFSTPNPTRPPPTTQRPQTSRPTTRRPFTFPITTLRPRPTTLPPRGGFAVKSPFVTTPPTPKLKPTTTKSPNRGKQLGGAPQPKPEPTGKEWEGEARFHAFHSYHYQRGDGRRNRNFGKRTGRDIKDDYPHSRFPRSSQTNPRVLQQKVPVRLSRSLHVVAPSDLPIHKDFMPGAKTPAPIFTDPLGTVCFDMMFFAPAVLAILFLLILTSTAALALYMRNRENPKINHYWTNY
ncbi:unnamed protein product [Meganyctiphanes norvegica]|uniref:ZP domain-containing protein n=1 Tax=Meganyctiphanes norvegica TaxID=48144 RepID=A0AAV2PYT2_MEGNR